MEDETKRIRQLMKVGFPTGSYHLGCEKFNDSDWVIRSSDWNSIVGIDLGCFFYKAHDYETSEFRCFFVRDKAGLLLNFIVMYEDKEYQIWKIATRLISRIPVRFLQNKGHRVALFEVLKDLVRFQLEAKPEPEPLKPFDPDDIPF